MALFFRLCILFLNIVLKHTKNIKNMSINKFLIKQAKKYRQDGFRQQHQMIVTILNVVTQRSKLPSFLFFDINKEQLLTITEKYELCQCKYCIIIAIQIERTFIMIIYQFLTNLLSPMSGQEYLNINTMFTTITNQGPLAHFTYQDDADSWMDQYFNKQVFSLKFSNEPVLSNYVEFDNTFLDLPHEKQPKKDSEEEGRRKNKSAFHNFQKHLLTLLKKVICVKKSQLVHIPYGNRAYQLWRIFLSQKSSSKKNLYIIFGIAQKENQTNLRKSAETIPELQRLLNKYQLRQIQQGQELLRRIVCRQASRLQKIKLQTECKMKKFEEFYAYFLGFMEELSEGAISRRMTKQRKIRLTQIQQVKQ